MVDWKKYFVVFLITALIFGLAFYLSDFLSNRKINKLQSLQEDVSLDILSSQTEFDLLAERSCESLGRSILASKLGELAEKIEFSERNIGKTSEVVRLKKQYSLFEIKDYLLMKRVLRRCNLPAYFVLYFYSNENCQDCEKEGFVLTALREKHPDLRVYSFDYDLDLGAIRALKDLYKIKPELPALVVNEKTFQGFQDMETLEKLLGFKQPKKK